MVPSRTEALGRGLAAFLWSGMNTDIHLPGISPTWLDPVWGRQCFPSFLRLRKPGQKWGSDLPRPQEKSETYRPFSECCAWNFPQRGSDYLRELESGRSVRSLSCVGKELHLFISAKPPEIRSGWFRLTCDHHSKTYLLYPIPGEWHLKVPIS